MNRLVQHLPSFKISFPSYNPIDLIIERRDVKSKLKSPRSPSNQPIDVRFFFFLIKTHDPALANSNIIHRFVGTQAEGKALSPRNANSLRRIDNFLRKQWNFPPIINRSGTNHRVELVSRNSTPVGKVFLERGGGGDGGPRRPIRC